MALNIIAGHFEEVLCLSASLNYSIPLCRTSTRHHLRTSGRGRLFVCLSVYLSVCLSRLIIIYLCAELALHIISGHLEQFVCLSVCLFVCLSVCLSRLIIIYLCAELALHIISGHLEEVVCLSVCLSICLSVCLSVSLNYNIPLCRTGTPHHLRTSGRGRLFVCLSQFLFLSFY